MTLGVVLCKPSMAAHHCQQSGMVCFLKPRATLDFSHVTATNYAPTNISHMQGAQCVMF
jgi:hypothetical protein